MKNLIKCPGAYWLLGRLVEEREGVIRISALRPLVLLVGMERFDWKLFCPLHPSPVWA